MMRKNQRTILKTVGFEGVGLFAGETGKMSIHPASPNAGVAFVRVDLPGRPRLPVTPDTVVSKFRRSAVAGENAEVETIEHIMSAIGGMGLDNLEIEIDTAEVPNADGSSLPFVELLRGGGVTEQPEPRRAHVVREPISVTENDSSIVAMPSEHGLRLSYSMNYPDSPIGQQHYTLELTDDSYARQISPARTFCLASEAEALLQQGLGKGAIRAAQSGAVTVRSVAIR